MTKRLSCQNILDYLHLKGSAPLYSWSGSLIGSAYFSLYISFRFRFNKTLTNLTSLRQHNLQYSLLFTGSKFFYSIEIYRPCIYRKIPVNTGKMCFIAFNLKTTGPCKFFLYLQDPVITEPCIFIALGSGHQFGPHVVQIFQRSCFCIFVLAMLWCFVAMV